MNKGTREGITAALIASATGLVIALAVAGVHSFGRTKGWWP